MDDDELDGTVERLARRLADGPTLAYAQTKSLITRELDMPLDAAMELDAMTQALLMTTADHAEFHAAFNDEATPAVEGTLMNARSTSLAVDDTVVRRTEDRDIRDTVRKLRRGRARPAHQRLVRAG